MTCDEVVNEEIVEKYILDELSEPSRDAFEQHYFECGRCFDLLQTHRALQAELAATREAATVETSRTRWVWHWTWAPAMAVLVVAVSVALWMRPAPAPVETPAAQAPPPGPVPPPEAPSGRAPRPVPPQPSLAELARVEPPAYTAGRLRGADAAAARFETAMTEYQRRNYGAAVEELRAAATLDPEAPHIAFYLGVSELLAGRTPAAIERLRRTIALGETPFLEDAHYYLAKAHLRSGDVDSAARELERTIEIEGEREAEARGLLAALASFRR